MLFAGDEQLMCCLPITKAYPWAVYEPLGMLFAQNEQPMSRLPIVKAYPWAIYAPLGMLFAKDEQPMSRLPIVKAYPGAVYMPMGMLFSQIRQPMGRPKSALHAAPHTNHPNRAQNIRAKTKDGPYPKAPCWTLRGGIPSFAVLYVVFPFHRHLLTQY